MVLINSRLLDLYIDRVNEVYGFLVLFLIIVKNVFGQSLIWEMIRFSLWYLFL